MVVELDPRLLEILACPSPDHAPLRPGTQDDPGADVLTCTACGRRFPVVDGVPVLLLDEAQPATDDAGDDRADDATGADGSPGEK
ncbi:Trm112 family protein [Pseudonocardia acaciae]|uniref:Trm112 family protein n=1 Tax=Pseudonocardia acaciae TaxID=551276 RepID=UPI00048DA399|nr:Trm112 family protein [Pseudonocardia acaciae]